ncbi:MAG TPA: peptide chain release factor N(5)-glutamine methyltransferase [Puia sp.]|nr:peptide chain release factor N(5)-glutamine methyltransferase [Puia sp.]
MTLHDAQQELISGLEKIYGAREAAVVADWVMENISGRKKIDRLVRKTEPLPTPALELLQKYSAELLTHRPVQYVLHESWFAGMKFYVDEHVLIPRPETEELVEWVAAEAMGMAEHSPNSGSAITAPLSLLDVGTGSGCIAVALAKKLQGPAAQSPQRSQAAASQKQMPQTFLPEPLIYACDISADALSVAERNASAHATPVQFMQLDFLDSRQRATLPPVHLLVSNPPYIPLKDKEGMARNVVGFEPHLALFVDNGDPLIFYRALAGHAREKLLPGGGIFVEIHEDLAAGVIAVFQEAGLLGIVVKRDMQGKERMIKATR